MQNTKWMVVDDATGARRPDIYTGRRHKTWEWNNGIGTGIGQFNRGMTGVQIVSFVRGCNVQLWSTLATLHAKQTPPPELTMNRVY